MSKYVACPNCSSDQSKMVGFTWWGGILGPVLLTHVKCPDCGTAHNDKTGGSNTSGITIYALAGAALGIGVVILYILFRFVL